MPSIDYAQYATIAELRDLIAETEAEVERRKAADRERFLAQAREIATQYNLTLEEFFQTPIKQRRGRVRTKYRNPDNPDETWTGRGKKPEWFEAALQRGLTQTEMVVAPEPE